MPLNKLLTTWLERESWNLPCASMTCPFEMTISLRLNEDNSSWNILDKERIKKGWVGAQPRKERGSWKRWLHVTPLSDEISIRRTPYFCEKMTVFLSFGKGRLFIPFPIDDSPKLILQKSIPLFHRKTIHEGPEFDDAHFNLARVLERVGDTKGTKDHWERYLDLDSSSEWAIYIKRRLDRK